MRRILIPVLVLLLCATSGMAVTLQQAYDAAGPGAGYQKLVYLDNETLYTGGLTLSTGPTCIISDGALIDLQGSRLIVTGNNQLDVCGVVLIGSDSAAIKYDAGKGWIDRVTFAQNYDGVTCWINANMRLTSNIFSFGTRYGFYCHDTGTRWIAYNDAWSNPGGDYRRWCTS